MDCLNRNFLLGICSEKKLKNCNQLEIQDQEITKIRIDAFQGLRKLQMLLLSCNKISEIEHNSKKSNISMSCQ